MSRSVPLIPRQVLFGNPDRAAVRWSPDGRYLSYLAPLEGVLNVWVAPRDDLSAARPITHDTHRGIRYYTWAYTNSHILYLQDRDGDENWRLYCVDLETDAVRELTPLEHVRAEVQEISPETPDEILVGLNDRRPQFHDLYRLNIRTGDRELVIRNDDFAGFVTDLQYRVRYAVRMTPDGGQQILCPTKEGGWEPYIEIGMEDALTTHPLGFDQTGETLYLFDSRGRDTAALVALDTKRNRTEVLFIDPHADASDIMMHPLTRHVEAVASTYLRKRWQVLDENIAEDLAYLETVADGEIEVVSRTLDDQLWIVAYLLDDGPVRYYRYDRPQKRVTFLFTNRQALEGTPLVKMHSTIIPARDGMELVSYYSLPLNADNDGDGLPDKPLPMVLYVHGGPWGRDTWGYNAIHQWLANRGYAVLSVNFRGSTGFGKAFINAGNLEWGRKMHNDLIDAVEWAVQKGIADRKRIAIMGGSYGGYATLAGLTMTPEVFACGVDIVGPSNLITLLESIPPYWEPMLQLFTTRVGDHRTEAGRAFLRERSPLTYAHRICRPLLIGQGANDPRVKRAESDQIVEEMRRHGIPVTYVIYSDEGHGFARPENRLSFYALTEAFLAKILQGRFEPIGDDLKGSTLSVQAGTELIPGLKEALST